MDGTRGFQAEKVTQLAEKLEEAGLVVSYYDERMTTVLAEDALLEANMSRENRKKKVDMVAAVMILQSYLDAQAMQNAQTVEDDSEEDEAELDDVLEMEDEDGNVYWHILDPETGYPAKSGLLSVTIICPQGRMGDALSTALFVMGPQKAEEYWRENGDFEMILVTEEGEILITEGVADRFTLSEGRTEEIRVISR